MKTLLTFCLLALSTCGWTQVGNDLEMYSVDGKKFTLVVAGQVINETPQSRVEIHDTPHDYLSDVVVRFEDESIPSLEYNTLLLSDPASSSKDPVAAVYRIIEKKGKYKVKFVSRSFKKKL